MAKTSSYIIGGKLCSTLKWIQIILFALAIISTCIALFLPSFGYSTDIVITFDKIIQVNILLIFVVSIISFAIGVWIVALNYYRKKDKEGLNSWLKFIKLGVIGMVFLIILYYAIGFLASLFGVSVNNTADSNLFMINSL